MPDAQVQFLEPFVKSGNVLLTNCGVSTADRIYLVKPDPGLFPDDQSLQTHFRRYTIFHLSFNQYF